MNQATNILLIVLAVIGAIALFGAACMWLMYGMMMGPGMASGFGLLLALVIIAIAVVLLLTRTKAAS
ncbi:MAG TPA: hypothetical protein VFV87_09405 [Pirellulaceae bacterium]|nr:hypothetical protein [Pirellulaceae bacterium]